VCVSYAPIALGGVSTVKGRLCPGVRGFPCRPEKINDVPGEPALLTVFESMSTQIGTLVGVTCGQTRALAVPLAIDNAAAIHAAFFSRSATMIGLPIRYLFTVTVFAPSM